MFLRNPSELLRTTNVTAQKIAVFTVFNMKTFNTTEICVRV
jgi:hypothetical protein